jgi:hypothetical protein
MALHNCRALSFQANAHHGQLVNSDSPPQHVTPSRKPVNLKSLRQILPPNVKCLRFSEMGCSRLIVFYSLKESPTSVGKIDVYFVDSMETIFYRDDTL